MLTLRRSLLFFTLILAIPTAVFAARSAVSQSRAANSQARAAVSQARLAATGGRLLVGLMDNLVFALPLEETLAGTRRDLVGNTTLTNAAVVTQGTGIVGNCGVFASASSQYLWTPGTITWLDFGVTVAGTIPANSGFTFAAWAKGTTFPTNPSVVISRQGGGAGQRGARLETTTTKAQFTVSQTGSADTSVTGATTLSTATWYYLTGVCDLSIPLTTIYVNGVSDGSSAAITAAWAPVGMPVSIGARSVIANGTGAAGFWNGSIDEVRIWTRALSAAEVLHEFNSGSGRAFPDR